MNVGRQSRVPFGVMAKPGSSKCNLDCKYCYYLEKERLYPSATSFVMSDEVLERFVREYIESQDTSDVGFIWQGGEPTLLGISFFEKALKFQSAYAAGKRIHNSIQTNGTLIDDDWARFLLEYRFLVGISIDGPQDLHDALRVDKRGTSQFDRLMKGWETLRAFEVETNILTVVSRLNGSEPLSVYRFLKSIGGQFIQFIPVVERNATSGMLDFAGPPARDTQVPDQVTEWSVRPEQYGDFLIAIYDEWVRQDVGAVFIQLFDVCLNVWCGRPAPMCWFSRDCGAALAIEHNGDLYSCDHYVYPEFRLGNLKDIPLAEMARSQVQRAFGLSKSATLPNYCKSCDVRFICNGECPKRRFLTTPDGEPGLNYLCEGYKRFFKHCFPTMNTMAALVRRGRPAAEVMKFARLP